MLNYYATTFLDNLPVIQQEGVYETTPTACLGVQNVAMEEQVGLVRIAREILDSCETVC